MKVLHVTEAMAAGVEMSLRTLTARQIEDGMSVTVMFTSRPDTPDDGELAEVFDSDVELVRLPRRHSSVRALADLGRAVRSASRSGSYDAVHLHSSIAGAAGRAALVAARHRVPVYYSPHGYAFLRRDLGPIVREAILLAERGLSRAGDGTILVSPSEKRLAMDRVRHGRFYMLQNGVSIDEFPVNHVESHGHRLVAAMVGRVTYARAPWRFADVARRLNALADFEWIGSGSAEDIERWLPGPVRVSGWLDRDALRERLSEVDVVVFPTLWEGLPMALIEAQAMGIPVVASDIVGNRDVIEDGVTGYLVESDEDLLAKTKDLLTDPALRERLGADGRKRMRAEFDDAPLGRASRAIYEGSGLRDRDAPGRQRTAEAEPQ